MGDNPRALASRLVDWPTGWLASSLRRGAASRLIFFICLQAQRRAEQPAGNLLAGWLAGWLAQGLLDNDK